MNNDLYIYFSIDLEKNIIVQCSQKKYIGYKYDAFFDEVLKNKLDNDNLKSDDILNSIKTQNKLTISSNNNVKYILDTDKFDESIVNCSLILNVVDDIDYLTGVYNRKYLHQEINKYLKENDKKDCALAIVDLNNFKNVNDKFGHLEGDRVLKEFAKNIKAILPQDALFGRYGGDEFVIFIKNPVFSTLCDISSKVLNISYKLGTQKKDIVTACLGFSMYNPDISTFDYLIENADKALYRAKNSGKRSAYLNESILFSLKKKNKISLDSKDFKMFDFEMKKLKLRQVLLVISILIIFVSLVFACIFYLKKSIYKSKFQETRNTMDIVSEQLELNVNKNLDAYFSSLSTINQAFENGDIAYEDFIFKFSENSMFDEIGVLNNDGIVIFSDRRSDLSNIEKTAELINDDKSWVDVVLFSDVGERMVFAIPSNDSKVAGLVGLITIDEFKTNLHATAFGGRSVIAITNSHGDILVSNDDIFAYNNIFTLIEHELSEAKSALVKESYLAGETDTINISFDGISYYLHYTPYSNGSDNKMIDNKEESDWYIVISVPVSEINKTITKEFNKILIGFLIFGILVILVLAGFLFYFTSTRIKIKRSKAIDDVTSGLNYDRFIQDATTLAKDNKDYAVVVADSKKFKYINNQIGKQKGDLLLKRIYDIYSTRLKKDELIARVYADRFIILMHDKDIESRIKKMNEDIKNEAANKFGVNIINLYGVFAPKSKIDDIGFAGNMARIALLSLREDYVSKTIAYFDSSMYLDEITYNSLEQKADMALKNGNFKVYYQAKKHLGNDNWCSCEALVRWQDDDKVLISPAKFIPLFENNGFIIELDLYIFKKVCEEIREALDNNLFVLPASVNVSRKHFVNKDFLKQYKKIMDEYKIPANYIEFEITESAVFENESILVDVINEIHEMGCMVSIDDFGTGYSSLSLLTNYEFDIVKIDRSFFYAKDGFSENSQKVVKYVISLAHDLGKDVVAEGIEEEWMVNFLKESKCDIIQGYYYAKPLPHDEFLEFINKTK